VLDTDGEQWKRKEGPELSSLRWIRIGFFSTDGGRVPCTVVVIRSLSAISGKSPKATQALDIEEKAIASTLKATEYRILELFMLLAACGQKKRRAVSHELRLLMISMLAVGSRCSLPWRMSSVR
jgi:hypothetical protein